MPLSTVSISSSLVFGTYRNVLHLLHELRHRSAADPHHRADIFLSGFAGGVAQVRCTRVGGVIEAHPLMHLPEEH